MENNMILSDISESLKGIKKDLDILVSDKAKDEEATENKDIEELIKEMMNDFGIKGNVVIREFNIGDK